MRDSSLCRAPRRSLRSTTFRIRCATRFSSVSPFSWDWLGGVKGKRFARALLPLPHPAGLWVLAILCLAAFACSTLRCAAFEPSYRGSAVIGGESADTARALAADGNDGFFLAGQFLGTADFDPGPGEVLRQAAPSADEAAGDVFITHLDGGLEHVRTVTFGGDGNDFATSATSDDGDRVIVAGGFEKTVDFDPGPDEALRSSQGRVDIFVSLFSQSLGWAWTYTWGEAGDDVPGQVHVTDAGSIVVVGSVEDGGETALGQPTSDVFVLRLSPEGDLQDNYQWGEVGVDERPLSSVALDGGQLFVLVHDRWKLDYPASPDRLVCLAGSGMPVWERTVRAVGTAISTDFDWIEWGAVASSDDGGLFVAGGLAGTVCVAELSVADGGLVWGELIAPVDGSSRATANCLDVQGNRVQIVGSFFGQVDFCPGPQTDALASSEGALFVTQFTNGGDYRGSWNAIDTELVEPFSAILTSSGRTAVAGDFLGTLVDFDPGPDEDLLDSRSWDAFVTVASALEKAIPPTSSPTSGIYESSVLGVALFATTPGAAIHYAVDGSVPTLSSPSLASGEPIDLDLPVTLRAFTAAPGFESSRVVTFCFVRDGWLLRMGVGGEAVLLGAFEGADPQPDTMDAPLASPAAERLFLHSDGANYAGLFMVPDTPLEWSLSVEALGPAEELNWEFQGKLPSDTYLSILPEEASRAEAEGAAQAVGIGLDMAKAAAVSLGPAEQAYRFRVVLDARLHGLLQLKPGWNLVHFPFVPDAATRVALLQEGDAVWSVDGEKLGQGYPDPPLRTGLWLRLPGDTGRQISVSGEPDANPVDRLGWDVVGVEIPLSLGRRNEAISYWRWQAIPGVYRVPANLLPGVGYWRYQLGE